MELVKKRKIFYLIGFFLVLLVLIFPVALFGQPPATPPPSVPPPFVPLAPLDNVVYDSTDIGGYLGGIFNFVLGLTALFAVVVIAFGGIQYITTDAIQGKSDGKARITRALLGLLLALISYIILYTINPELISFNFNPADSADSGSSNGDGPGIE